MTLEEIARDVEKRLKEQGYRNPKVLPSVWPRRTNNPEWWGTEKEKDMWISPFVGSVGSMANGTFIHVNPAWESAVYEEVHWQASPVWDSESVVPQPYVGLLKKENDES